MNKEGYFYRYNSVCGRGVGELVPAKVVFVILCFLFVLSTALCPILWVQFNREKYQLGDGYLKLAEESSSLEMSVGYLELYKEAIEENKLNTGTAGLFYKTPNNDMSYRYERLVKGIEFLKMFTGKTELDERINTLDINMYSMMVDSSNDSDKPALKQYISSLSIGIGQYLSANYIGWRICDVGSLVFLLMSSVLFLVILIMGMVLHI